MYRRALPRFADLKAFLTYLDDQGEVAEIRQSVDMNLELTEIHRRVIAEGGPVLRLARPTVGGEFGGVQVVANLYGTRRRVVAALGLECRDNGTDVAGLGEMLAFLRSPRPPKGVAELKSLWPVARAALNSRPKVVRDTTGWVHLGADLTRLPIQTCWPEDAGPLITWPMVITRPPGEDIFDGYNLGVYRMQVLGPDAAIMRWLPMRGGAAHHRQWMRAGAEMPVAVVIGADPATMMGAVMPSPEGVTELSLAGILAGERIGMVPCRDLPLHVPASSEIVIEGTISPGDLAPEGPFGDHTGYYNPPEMHAVFRIKSIRMREGGVYLTTFTGRAPDEPSVIGDVMADLFKPLLRQMLPEVVDLWLPPETCSYRVAVLAIDKRYAGQARRVMMGFWSLLPQFSMTKMVIVVDDDIDIRSWSDVMWAVATRSDPSRDVMIADRTPIDHLDFASPLEGLGGKIGIDATNKIGAETSRGWGRVMKMDAGVQVAVDRRWDSLFGKD
ncbi:UbiD family decarboxylase [Oryzibacter oryziterrae]|uniref:UbiD family decarboxylase n=1 Tax=Oryzibacter oryziterrae TaxID=2766474 RepID=UPI001F36E4C4|nr:UbiD family decarboxylase [Oryzibacter oryziterrae]